MTGRSEDRSALEVALAGLPAATASEGFTERVERELKRRARRPETVRWRAAALAVALAAAAGAFVWHQGQRSQTAERARQIRQQHLELQRELADLRALASESDPLLYLGGDESFDLVLDMGPLVDARPSGGFLPAIYTTPPEDHRE